MGAADAPRYVSALPSRSTRGRRLATLLEDEDSADEAFWNQDALAEESGDDAYESEEEPEDVFEDDFDESESSESCLLYTSPSPRDRQKSRMPSSA